MRKRTKEEISYNMSRIKNKDTSIEVSLRKALYHSGYRYYKNYSNLPGHPDIVLKGYKTAIFCDGDFFHGYDLRKTEEQLRNCKPYWKEKIEKNRRRDLETNEKLVALGYKVLRFWEHEIKEDLKRVLREIDLVCLEKDKK
ncbi:MAG: very short patch repair endonuclease [Bacilli bacterium]